MFKVGDRVKCIDESSLPDKQLKKNKYYIVRGLQDDDDAFIWVSDLKGNKIGTWSGAEDGYHYMKSRFKVMDDACGKCINNCRMDEKCPFYQEGN